MARRALWLLGSLGALGSLAALAVAAEAAWLAGHPRIADLMGVSRLAICWLWFVPAWKSLRGTQHGAWAHAGRTTLAAILVFAVLT